jgi:Protein of unknown function (DUF2510)/HIRAN domain
MVRLGDRVRVGKELELWVQTPTWANQEVAGESHYVDALAALVDGPVSESGTEVWVPAQLRPEPDNRHDRNAVAVVCRDRVVGYLPKEDAVRYSTPLQQLVAGGFAPTTKARVWVGRRPSWDERRGSTVVASVQVCLPEPHMLTPVNAAPAETHVLLPHGAAIQVSGEEKHLSALVPHLRAEREAWVHATLHPLDETSGRTSKTVVEVRVDGERVGQLTPRMSGELLPVVAHLADRGTTTAVRAIVKGNRLKADVVLHCARAGELSDDWFGESGTSASPTPPEPPAPAQMPPPVAPQGWYADPSARDQWRWWDGAAWTDHVAPMEAAR